jgi:hypothetical protein
MIIKSLVCIICSPFGLESLILIKNPIIDANQISYMA